MDTSLSLGLDQLCRGRKSFINCTRSVLLKGLVHRFPAPLTVVEVLESVQDNVAVMAACLDLQQKGYRIALDDFVMGDGRDNLAEIADILKVDVQAVSISDAEALIRRYGAHSKMLAEKVQTREQFSTATSLGFDYFQGFFFEHPTTIAAYNLEAK